MRERGRAREGTRRERSVAENKVNQRIKTLFSLLFHFVYVLKHE